MKRHLITAALALTIASSGLAAGAQPYQGQHREQAYQGCFPGERSSDCRARQSVERRGQHRYVRRDDGRYEERDSSGAAIASGILGFVLGAAIAGSASDRDYYVSHRHDRGWRNRCRSEYRGFDYRTGTYMGPDGYRHYCTR